MKHMIKKTVALVALGLVCGLAAAPQAEAAKRPKQNFPYPFENGQNVLLPHFAKFKGITQLLQHSAEIKLARGD